MKNVTLFVAGKLLEYSYSEPYLQDGDIKLDFTLADVEFDVKNAIPAGGFEFDSGWLAAAVDTGIDPKSMPANGYCYMVYPGEPDDEAEVVKAEPFDFAKYNGIK